MQEIEVLCTCRLTEDSDLDMAECKSCEQWFHRHCLDIPDNVLANVMFAGYVRHVLRRSQLPALSTLRLDLQHTVPCTCVLVFV